MIHPISKLVAERLKEIRKKKRITGSSIEQEVGLAKGYISKLECGEFNPGIDKILKILWFMGYPINKFFKQIDKDANQ